jgi:outer membrane protein assembly factor BamA
MYSSGRFSGLIVIFMSLLISLSNCVYAQTVFIDEGKNIPAIFLRRLATEMPAVSDSMAFYRSLRDAQEKILQEGYLEASVDSLQVRDSSATVWWHSGPVYRWGMLHTDQTTDVLLSEAGVRDKFYRSKPLSPASIASLHRKVLTYCENNGYPFALVKLDSISVQDAQLNARYIVDKGPLILFDSAEVRGTARLSNAYLFNYLSLKPGTPYSQASVQRIRNRLKELPFVAESRPFELGFTDSTARPVFFLQQKKASQFNGVIGILPDDEISGKVYVTGDLRLRLHNVFGRAELLDLNWSNPQPRSQDLKVKFSYPFLFDFPFGLDAELTLFKKDTIFLEFFRQIGLRYFLQGNSSVRAFAGIRSSSLISTKGYEFISTLPDFADVRTVQYGLGLSLERVDYRLNPRKGFVIEVSSSAGLRTVSRNARLNPEVYDSVDLKTTQYRAELLSDVFLPVGGRGVVNLNVSGGWLESPSIFRNELFRIGGLRSLRGFDEQSILASRYVTGRIETRFILEQNSYLLAFYNQGFIGDYSGKRTVEDDPSGFGAGLTFDTKLGIFSFIYALGRQQNNPIEFRAAKIHFGLLNTF